jgi:hypothetical protein
MSADLSRLIEWLAAHPGCFLLAAGVLLALGVLLGNAWSRRRRRRRILRRLRRGRELESKGDELLRRAGYRILGSQVECDAALILDGDRHPYSIRVDRLVERRGRRYAVELKSGRTAPRLPASSATRRQLLEYLLAYDVDGLLLVDLEQGRIHEVRFSFGPGSAARRWGLWAATLAVLAALAALALLRG